MTPPFWIVCALLSIGSASTGQILLKLGVARRSVPGGSMFAPGPLFALMTDPMVMGGIVAFALSLVLWLGAIRGQELSRVYPMAALGYVSVMLLSARILHEPVTLGKVAGIALIVFGVSILNGNPFGRPAAAAAISQGTTR